ncbi:hypothetical protein DVG78_11255 [Runella aurantiaca]|uniref:Tyrosinase copper-binding domain-containing protein n=2 Tax=Runella aurantiaca TaxID=2282308 RepID=A0A369IH70_9BACT|nr:hypothetical protein DVG78_11255 [Runella aurantiaca]
MVMFNSFYFSTGIILLILGVSNNVDFKPKSSASSEIVICKTDDLESLPATSFTNNATNPMAVMVRKNVYSLTAAEIASIKTGIAAMKALPTTNKTSWAYQAAIHGTTLTNNLPSWNSCQHRTQFFLSWHRMYLYFFERILRAKSGNPNLTLPYWNYQTNAVLHPAYRNSAASNTLYNSTRNASINSGGALPASISTSINNALNNIPFFDFNSDLEGPHGSVHVAIGGNMGSVNRAALDPVFWLHHTNIDRLWEAWLRKCGGRQNPTSGAWATQNFTFFDENGTAVTMSGSQIVKTATQLNYRYDFPFMLPCNFVIANLERWRWITFRPLRIEGITKIENNRAKISFARSNAATFDKMIRDNKMDKILVSTTDISDKLFVELEDIKVDKLPEGTVEIYLNLPANEVPTSKSKSFAGTLDLFTATAHEGHGEKHPIMINVTTAVNALKLKPSDLKKAELTVVVRGNSVKGSEIKTNGNVQIGAINFVIQKAQK